MIIPRNKKKSEIIYLRILGLPDLNMCEWLARGEWCDVKLLCGGRSFSAHRAVLASASSFLRRIFLSCPADETPTFIVLPDFDLEAMSSVLFYIYNGEVILQKNKLGFFLDIIQAMQIYIDGQYLPKISETVEEGSFDFYSCHDVNMLKTDIFTLGLGDIKDQRMFNLKKGMEMQSVLLQYSQSEADFHDNTVRSQNGSELRKSRLGNLKSPCGDRQRNSFLRDLFIETYPRNGNVNGLTEGVLAISNECYRSPASVLSTTVNREHLSSDALSIFGTNTRQTLNMSALLHPSQQLQCKIPTRSTYPPYKNCPIETSDMTFIYGNSEAAAEFPNDRTPFLPQQLNDKSIMSGINTSLDFRQSLLEIMKCRSLMPNSTLRSECEEKRKELKSTNPPRIIFNQVLENPWSPRKPSNYRPFRRKEEHSHSQNQKFQVEKINIVNDSNNNIQIATVTEAGQNVISGSGVPLEAGEPPASNSPIPTSRDSFKCTHCNQVFTSSESLAVHMRRHSATARYTCGECGKTFSQLRNFKYHMSIHRGTREFAATCTVCGKYFNDRGYLSSHMKIHRNRKEYKCTLCPKSFNQRVAYNMHVRIHTGVKPHACAECGKAFSRKMLLKQHQRTHSGERPYACPHCDKRFADRSNMTLHLRLHTGVKPFSCSLCPKSFTKKHHLKSHLNFHTGSKPYSCPRCKLAFTQSSNMRTHYKKCSAPDPGSGNDSQSNL